MNMVSIAGIGLTALILIILLRQYRPEYAVMASIVTGLLFVGLILKALDGVIGEIGGILDATGAGYAQVLFKIIGVCFLVQIAADTCRDSGESALAAKIEIAGRVSILILALPLYTRVLEIATELIGG